jgi:hypothetical protein
MDRYEYRTLAFDRDEIRLFDLQPGDVHDPIHIILEHYPLVPLEPPLTERLSIRELQATLPHGKRARETLNGRYFFGDEGYSAVTWDHPIASFPAAKYAAIDNETALATTKYEALSYLWGEALEKKSILISSTNPPHEKPKELLINSNLFEALKQMRHSQSSRRLWVDAICINQEDLSERAREVLRMAQIYGLAHHVLIWLGREVASTSKAVQALQLWGRDVVKDKHGQRCFCSPSGRFPNGEWNEGIRAAIRSEDGQVYQAVNEYLGRAYLGRLWVCFQHMECSLDPYRSKLTYIQDLAGNQAIKTSRHRLLRTALHLMD